MQLTAIHDFGKYKKGDAITDQKEVKTILDSEQAAYVVKTADPAPAPAEDKAK